METSRPGATINTRSSAEPPGLQLLFASLFGELGGRADGSAEETEPGDEPAPSDERGAGLPQPAITGHALSAMTPAPGGLATGLWTARRRSLAEGRDGSAGDNGIGALVDRIKPEAATAFPIATPELPSAGSKSWVALPRDAASGLIHSGHVVIAAESCGVSATPSSVLAGRFTSYQTIAKTLVQSGVGGKRAVVPQPPLAPSHNNAENESGELQLTAAPQIPLVSVTAAVTAIPIALAKSPIGSSTDERKGDVDPSPADASAIIEPPKDLNRSMSREESAAATENSRPHPVEPEVIPAAVPPVLLRLRDSKETSRTPRASGHRTDAEPERLQAPVPMTSANTAGTRTTPVRSMPGPSTAPPDSAQHADTEGVRPSVDLNVRRLAPAAPDTGELSFTARLAPATSDSALPDPPPSRSNLRPQEVPPVRTTQPAIQASAESLPGSRNESHDTAKPSGQTVPVRKPDPESGPGREVPTVTQDVRHFQTRATPDVQLRQASPEPAVCDQASEAPRTADAEPVQPAVHAPGPAREIRLALTSDGERVEVKLCERAGELQVAVRTPDHHLAERLRSDLPALSSRLEASGMRTETWHPSAVQELRGELHSSMNSQNGQPDDSPQQQHREHQGQREPRRRREPQEDQQPRKKGKDFEWFLSTIQ